MRLFKDIIKLIIYPFIFLFGLFYFIISKKTNNHAYAAFRYLFVLSDGWINDISSKIISLFNPRFQIQQSQGLLGILDDDQVNKICNEIKRDGYYNFNFYLNEQTIEKLVKFSKETPLRVLNLNTSKIEYKNDFVTFDLNNPISPRYQFTADQILTCSEATDLVFDENLLHIANNYFNSKPILDIITMWWSVPFGGKGQSQAAQMFHFDMDRIKFLKFFFYLSDVTTSTGPHCYVKGTHITIPDKVRKDMRIPDNSLEQYFKKEDIIEIIGKKGSIIAVDTRGLHKGKPLTEGYRLLFQLQFSNSLFGASYEKFNTPKDIDMSSQSKSTFKKYGKTFSLFN